MKEVDNPGIGPEDPPRMVSPTSPPRAKLEDVARLAFFALFWILPVTYHGLSGSQRMPGWPRTLVHLTNISCLFTESMSTWPFDYIQVQTGSDEWTTLEESDYFRMPAFGYRTRFDELTRRGLGDPPLQELAYWVAKRHRELHPQSPPVTALRLVRAFISLADPIPEGHWRDPPLTAVPPDRQRVWFMVTFNPR